MKNLWTYKSIFLLFLCFAFQTHLRASHIVGGNITYQCLGGNQYQVTARLLRDCNGANLFANINLSALNQTSGTISNHNLNRISIDTLPLNNAANCAQSGFCVEEHVYQGIINLPNNLDGYDLRFSSCCRNGGVINTNAGGFRMHTNMPPPQLCNSSPTFNPQFTTIFCVNQSGCVDLSATDPDGDQLNYRFVAPLDQGGNPVAYNPPFTLANFMNGNPAMTIDPLTGQACVTPTQLGLFVATVEIDEVRAGQVIGQTRRDIQILVVNCPPPPVACFSLPDTICINSSIVPNLSCMPGNITSYRWVIHEMNPPGPWIPLYYSPYLPGPVPATNLKNLWNGYQAGKSYGISIDVFNACGNHSTYREVYIAPRPPQFSFSAGYLGCEDDCLTLVCDPNSDPALTEGAPFTMSWNNGSTNPTRTVCPDVPTTYYAFVTNRWGCTSTWSYFVDKDTCCLEPCFELPDTACVNGPIFPDLSCMRQNIDSYRWAIHEMDPPNPWIPKHYTPYLSGPVVSVDFTSLWSGFEAGKTYGISIDVFKTCGVNATIYREVYIVPQPTQQMIVQSFPLSCEDNCLTIGDDILLNFGLATNDPGAPYTVEWDDASTSYQRVVCPTEPTLYTAIIRNRWGCEASWSYFVDKDTCCLDPCFSLPDTVCEGDPIFPDLSCMQQDIDSYRWAIHEMDPPNPWIPKHYTPYLSGPVASVDFTTLWNGFEAGKSYGISIDVFKNCGANASTYREVYIAARPTQQLVINAYPLSCEENCFNLGDDLLNNFGLATHDPGAPFTVEWDDASTSFQRVVCPTEPTLYTAIIRNRWGCEASWSYYVDKDTCCLDPCFSLPDTVCEGDPIIPDLSCMQQDIDSYRWAIHEMDPPGPWIPKHYTPYLPGPVAAVDFTTLWNGFEAGKSYGISIDVFKNCGANATIYHEVYIQPILTEIREVCVNIEGKVLLEPCSGASGPFDYVINGNAISSSNTSMEVTYSPGDSYEVISYDAHGCPCTVQYVVIPPPPPVSVFAIWCAGQMQFDFSSLIDPACLAAVDSFTLINTYNNNHIPLFVNDPSGGWDFVTAEGLGDLICLQFVSYKDGCIVCIVNISMVFTNGNCENQPEIWCTPSKLAKPFSGILEPKIVPNPTVARFQIHAGKAEAEINFDKVTITTPNGATIQSYTHVLSSRDYDLSMLADGIYFVHVFHQGKLYSMKLVLMH